LLHVRSELELTLPLLQVHYVESSPADQLQPKHSTRHYAKPGDALDVAQPVLFEIETRKQIIIDNALFPNPYSLSNSSWRKDSHAFTFEYNQRGHQAYRIIEVDAATGAMGWPLGPHYAASSNV